MPFLDLQRQVQKASFQNPTMKIALLGDVSTQFLKIAIQGVGLKEGAKIQVYESPYDVIQQEVFDSESFLYKKKPDAIVLYFSSEKLLSRFYQTEEACRSGFAENFLSTLRVLFDTITTLLPKTSILIYDFIERDDGVFGNYALKCEESFLFQIRKINLLLSEEAEKRKNLFPISLASLALEKGMENFSSYPLYDSSRVTIRTDDLEEVAQRTVALLLALRGRIRKGIILDLDNTLWGGVIGDDGIDKIEIGELGRGRSFLRFQQYLKELKERGIILCVCSKNDDEKAKEPFLRHPEMALRLDDFVLFIANWEDKATNIRLIQSTLNIGMDSLVFLDDNPCERNLVRSLIPDIIVPELPSDPSLYVSYLSSLDLFEVPSLSAEDRKRADQYRSEGKRLESKAKFSTLEDYLKDLGMVSQYSSFRKEDYPRLSELSLRSNQFNLRTVRYSEEEIRKIAMDPECLTYEFHLKDRYGDSGLISEVILKKQGDSLLIDTWLMSCRVLKRTMEAFIINTLTEEAKKNHFRTLVGEYLPTLKNAMVKGLYEEMGFTPKKDGKWIADVTEKKPLVTYITGESYDGK
jgi:FkbH-like protein